MAECTTLTSEGQVNVPKEIMDRLKWTEGAKPKFFLDGEEVQVMQVTILDEIEDLLVKDLLDLGYEGEELKTRLFERKTALNKAFDKMLEERLKEATVPLEEAIRSIENDI